MAGGETQGLAEFNRFVSSLEKDIPNNILRGAARAGAKVVAAEAELLVPVEHGDTKKSIGVGSARIVGEGTVRIRIRTKGPGAFKAPWLEWGTAAHFISIADADLPTAPTSRGKLTMGVGQVNRLAKRGSLVIEGKFAESVHHPGARPHPFMGPALENTRVTSLQAAAAYIRRRLAKGDFKSPPTETGE